MFHGVKGCTGCSYARRSLAIWSSVLQPGSLSASRQQGEHDRRRACRINTRAPRHKQNSRMPRWQARTSAAVLSPRIRAPCAPLHPMEHRRSICCQGMASVANRAHCRRNPRAKKEKGQSRRELSERLDVGRPEMFGGLLVPNISGSMGSDCGPLRRRHSAQKAVPFPLVAGRWG